MKEIQTEDDQQLVDLWKCGQYPYGHLIQHDLIQRDLVILSNVYVVEQSYNVQRVRRKTSCVHTIQLIRWFVDGTERLYNQSQHKTISMNTTNHSHYETKSISKTFVCTNSRVHQTERGKERDSSILHEDHWLTTR